MINLHNIETVFSTLKARLNIENNDTGVYNYINKILMQQHMKRLKKQENCLVNCLVN